MKPCLSGGRNPPMKIVRLVTTLLIAQHFGLMTGQLYDGQTVEEACPNAFLYENPVCQNNGTLHIGSRVNGTKSCSSCDCTEGWGGVDCGRCSDVSVCPDKVVNGTVLSATNCSSSSLIPTAEESEQQELGKIFSCSCGGGGDAWTDAVCSLQPETYVVFTMSGPGTDESPASMTFTLYAGTDTTYQESWDGENTYFYPVVFEGTAENCKVTRGSCLPVEETDIGDQECVRFDCENAQGNCPPEGYEVCDGFPSCSNEDDQEYQVHTCVASPALGKPITIACVDDQVDGTYICYYQQPDEFAPLSVTCTVGSCLYEGTEVITVETVSRKESPLDMEEQTAILVAGALFLGILFVIFAVLSDWGSARRESMSCCFSKSLETKAAAASGGAVVGDTSANSAIATLAGRRSFGKVSPSSTTPALLEWRDLSYAVELKQGGEGAVGCLLSGCRRPQLAVLSKVSGFAGPREEPPPTTAAAASAAAAGIPRPSSMSSCLSAMAASSDAAFRAPVASAVATELLEPDGPTPSTMTGILGPSGAGKSSLLDVLAGRKRSGEGCAVGRISLFLDGERRRRGGRDQGTGESPREGNIILGPGEIRRVAGYVPQEDVLPGTLSCYEHLMFHARLRMPREATYAERRARALTVLDELGLSRVADSRIGDTLKRGISGGEKRRVSIAAELMGRPPLLFLDEATTGLDAAAALRVMVLLKGVASRGTTVVCSLHQPRPRVLNLLDNVMLLSGGQVAYFGAPGDAEAYFSSVGRPFPHGQPHSADAMLALCCREDGCALPMLFERCGLVENSVFRGLPQSSGHFAMSPVLLPTVSSPPVMAVAVDSGLDRKHQGVADVEAGDAGGDLDGGGDGGEEGAGRRCVLPRTAGFLVQTEALSRRLLLRAVRHPLLMVLHFGGSLAMAICLGTIFEGKLEFTLEGAQSRFGALFFILLYLSLLSLTSLPVWREDRKLFLTETMGGAYGHLSYFTSVALVDVLLIRVLPPLIFAVVAYPVMGLNTFSDGVLTLLWFALILVLTNVAVALAAMGIGALGLPLDLSNLLGGAMVLLFVLFGRFLLNGDRITSAWRWLSNVTPIGYAYESLLVLEFNDPLSARPYTINGSTCSPDLPVIKPLGFTILKTFDFDPSLKEMRSNVGWLALIVLIFWCISFVLFYLFTRTSPLKVHKSEKGRRRIPSRPTSASFKNGGVAAAEAAAENDGSPLVSGLQADGVTSRESESRSGVAGTVETVAAEELQPILLSWEDIGFSIPSRGGARSAVLDGVSGFAGALVVAAPASVTTSEVLRVPKETAASVDKATVASVDESPLTWCGSVTAIMGPSGAGKTSLLNVLAGRHREMSGFSGGCCGGGVRVEGAVRVNGVEVGPATVRSISGYVAQEDVLPETMTCFEHLMFHAELRLKWGVCSNRANRESRVLEVMRELHIENIRDSRIGGELVRGISGGERRRLSIGTELLTRPRLLFLDEPTTGLDSSTALTIMKLLSDVAARGTTVMCSLHQPRPQAFNLLDGVLLMSRGRVAFFGPPSSVAEHFVSIGRPFGGAVDASGEGGEVGNADAMLDAVAEAEGVEDDRVSAVTGTGGDRAEEEKEGDGNGAEEEKGFSSACDHVDGEGTLVMPRDFLIEKVRNAESLAPPPLSFAAIIAGRGVCCYCGSASRTASLPVQLKALFGRALLNVARDPYLGALHVLLLPLAGLLMGTLFGDLTRLNEETAGVQGRLGAIFFFLLFLSLLGLTSLAPWVKQMALFRHERTSGAYGAFAHLSTSFLADALACRVVPPALLAATVRPLIGLRDGSFSGLYTGLVVFNLAVAGVLAACGTGARSGQEALAMGCLFVLFSALLSGYLVSRDDLPALWEALAWASPFAHGFEALAINEFSEYGFLFKLSTEINGYPATTPLLSGDNILSCFGFDEDLFDEDLLILAAIGAAGLVLAYGLLKRA